jgi:hypothetical protein
MTVCIDFPTTPGAFDPTVDTSVSRDFVTKLSASGAALDYSTYIGGGEGHGIAVDSAGNAYVAGVVGLDFPTTSGAFQDTADGGSSFVTKLDASGSSLVYSSRLGGPFPSGGDMALDIAVDESGSAYVTGIRNSQDFPTTPGAFQTTGDGNVFVTKFNATGSELVYSTYLGGNAGEDGFGIAVDNAGNAYVTGDTYSSDFPTTPGAYRTTPDPDIGGVFVTKLNATGSALVYSTYLGGSNSDIGLDIAVDALGIAYVVGLTASADFPVVNAVQPVPGGGSCFNPGGGRPPMPPRPRPCSDAFVTQLNAAGSALLSSTYLGGAGDDEGRAVAVDAAGNATSPAIPSQPTSPPLTRCSLASAAFEMPLSQSSVGALWRLPLQARPSRSLQRQRQQVKWVLQSAIPTTWAVGAT